MPDNRVKLKPVHTKIIIGLRKVTSVIAFLYGLLIGLVLGNFLTYIIERIEK